MENNSTNQEQPAAQEPSPISAGPDAAQQPTGDTLSNNGATEPKNNRKKWAIVGISVAVVLLLVAVYLVFGHKKSSSSAAQSNKVYHVGILDAYDSFFGSTNQGFKDKMTQLGYVEGKNITYDIVKTPNLTGNQATVQKFIKNKVDLVVAYPTEASLEAKDTLKNTGIPLIFANAAAEGSGLVHSVQEPGTDITGVRYPVPEIAVKRLDTLHELVPSAKRYWLPVMKNYPSVPAAVDAATNEAKNLGVTLTTSYFDSPDELKAYLAKLPATGDVGMDAIVEVAEPLSVIPDAYNAIDQFAVQHKLPVGGSTSTQDASSPIFVIFPNPEPVGQLAAGLADKIFKGTPAGNVPVVTPSSDTIVSLKAMQRLGITPSDGFLSTAKQIIK
jgi:putative ABC transport system substrate-binding protein